MPLVSPFESASAAGPQPLTRPAALVTPTLVTEVSGDARWRRVVVQSDGGRASGAKLIFQERATQRIPRYKHLQGDYAAKESEPGLRIHSRCIQLKGWPLWRPPVQTEPSDTTGADRRRYGRLVSPAARAAADDATLLSFVVAGCGGERGVLRRVTRRPRRLRRRIQLQREPGQGEDTAPDPVREG